MNERARAVELLTRIERDAAYASLILRNESGFVRTLVLGVLRWRSRLDWVVGRFAKRRVDAGLLDLLRVGAFQLIYSDVVPYAAVAETVEIAPRHARGFVNAILRRIADAPPGEPPDLATRTAHPAWMIARWERNYGSARAEAIARADQELSYPDVLQLSDETPPDAEPSRLVEGVWRLRGSSAKLDREHFWPMDEGSAVVAAVASNAGAEVLDLAAAPGSKTLYMLSRGRRVVSCDVSFNRIAPLAARTHGAVVADGRAAPFRRRIEAVLLDAPCSATGTIRKNPELKWRLQEPDLARFASLQRELLGSALSLAARICIYSTCSLEPEENDEVVRGSGAERIDIGEYVPPGASRWVEDGVLRLTPESGADGFTAFALRPPR